jgi:hypothetical protein
LRVRTSEQIMADAEDRSPFSNGSEYDYWADRWCYRCRNDNEETEQWCPILSAAMLRVTPKEWTPSGENGRVYGNYHCSEFEERRDDGDDPDPDPEPDPGPAPPIDGQVDMFEVFADQITERAMRPQPVSV